MREKACSGGHLPGLRHAGPGRSPPARARGVDLLARPREAPKVSGRALVVAFAAPRSEARPRRSTPGGAVSAALSHTRPRQTATIGPTSVAGPR